MLTHIPRQIPGLDRQVVELVLWLCRREVGEEPVLFVFPQGFQDCDFAGGVCGPLFVHRLGSGDGGGRDACE